MGLKSGWFPSFWALITFRNLRSAIGGLIRLIRNPFRGVIVSWWKFCSRVTIIIPASKNTKASVSLQKCTCADFYQSDESKLRRSCTTPTGHDIAPFFPLPFQHWAGEPLRKLFPERCSRKLLGPAMEQEAFAGVSPKNLSSTLL